MHRVQKRSGRKEQVSMGYGTGGGEIVSRVAHGAVIKDLAFAALNKALRFLEKIDDGSDEGLHRADHRADPGRAERSADFLLEFCTSFVIENRHGYLFILLADQIEFALQCNPVVLR